MKLIGIYSGQFQPPHQGCLVAYKRLKQITGNDTFIATTNTIDRPDSPLSFADKEQILVKHGVPSNKIIKVENIFKPIEITHHYDPEFTSIIFVFNQKELNNVVGRIGKDPITGKRIYLNIGGNKPSYFQPYEDNKSNLKPLNQNGYVIIFDDSIIKGRPINGPTIRKGLGSPQFIHEDKIVFFKWVFGWYDPSLFDMMKNKYTDAQKSTPDESKTYNLDEPMVQESLKKYIKKTIKELVATPQSTMGTTLSTTLSTADAANSDEDPKVKQSNRQSAQLQKTQVQKEKDQTEMTADAYKKKGKNWDQFEKKNFEKKIQDLNKAIATGEPVDPTSPM